MFVTSVKWPRAYCKAHYQQAQVPHENLLHFKMKFVIK